jgi:hypothetical protein
MRSVLVSAVSACSANDASVTKPSLRSTVSEHLAANGLHCVHLQTQTVTDQHSLRTRCNLVYHWICTAFVIELVRTRMGAVDICWGTSGAAGQSVAAWIIRTHGLTENGSHTEKRYRIGLWWFRVAFTVLSNNLVLS